MAMCMDPRVVGAIMRTKDTSLARRTLVLNQTIAIARTERQWLYALLLNGDCRCDDAHLMGEETPRKDRRGYRISPQDSC